ncbi:metal ion binding protein [Salix suchowensis]|nr:metal ion binding protein [Salix suchowensis]
MTTLSTFSALHSVCTPNAPGTPSPPLTRRITTRFHGLPVSFKHLALKRPAEGTMNETAIPKVTKALEGTEGVADLKVQVLEGIASVELTKQTTVQATGVASSLVELVQSSGFKLQTLNLSFQDEEDALPV